MEDYYMLKVFKTRYKSKEEIEEERNNISFNLHGGAINHAHVDPSETVELLSAAFNEDEFLKIRDEIVKKIGG